MSARVSIVMGSESDRDTMSLCAEVLDSLGIAYELEVMSAHRNPDRVAAFAEGARERGVSVIIAGAGLAAHLAGAIASRTVLPVIGVPLASEPFRGLDSLLSTVQMPKGIPVATVAVGRHGARNAAYLAAQVLALSDGGLRDRLESLRSS